MDSADVCLQFELSVSPSVRKLPNIIDETASNSALNSRVPPQNMMRVLVSAIRWGATSEIKNALHEIDLAGRKCDDVIEEVVLVTVRYEDYAFLNTLLNT
jgi:hypothetical protein